MIGKSVIYVGVDFGFAEALAAVSVVDGDGTVMVCYSDSGYMYPPMTSENDERTNPKAWARWFREFLFEKFGWSGDVVVAEETAAKVKHIVRRCRSGTLSVREWKMKLWKQNL